MNQEQANQIIDCRDNIILFANTNIKHQSSFNDDIVQLKLNEFQINVINLYNERKTFSLSVNRQEGKSTVAAIIALHHILFNEHAVVLLFAPKRALSDDLIKIIKDMYNRLPEHMKLTGIVETNNNNELWFTNGSKILSKGSNFSSCKAITYTLVYIDEIDWFADISDFRSLLSTIAPSSKIFGLSTPFSSEFLNILN